ncbi:MAG: SDR family NAD(P)-dependent oxidoreductase [Protaetiibacter sp.]
MGRLTDKVAIITGAASGMGLAGARIFAHEGARVVMVDVTGDKLTAAAAAIAAEGGEVLPIVLDVTSADDWRDAVQRAVDAYGRIDVLVNNAGIVTVSSVVETEEAEWDRVLGVNAKGYWLGMKHVIPRMLEQGGGSIVNVASIAAITGGKGSAAYSASKGAVLALTRQAADTYAKDSIRVNAILPGLVFTGMIEAAGLHSKEDAAAAIGQLTPLPPHAGDAEDIGYGMLYLASAESKFVTGAEIVIDGGWTVA